MNAAREEALLEEISAQREANRKLREAATKPGPTSAGKIVALCLLSVLLGLGVYVTKVAVAQPPEQPLRPTTRLIPMATNRLEPGDIVRQDDLGIGLWPTEDLRGDALLGDVAIVGKLVVEPIEPATVIRASSLRRLPDAPPTDD